MPAEIFYCYYASTSPNGMRVAKFSHKENSGGTKSRGDKSSEQVLFQDPDGIVRDCLRLARMRLARMGLARMGLGGYVLTAVDCRRAKPMPLALCTMVWQQSCAMTTALLADLNA